MLFLIFIAFLINLPNRQSEEAMSEDNFYVKGYNLNYSSGSLSKSNSKDSSEFINTVFEKSLTPNKELFGKSFSASLTKKEKPSPISTTSTFGASGNVLGPEEIRDRCRVAIEGKHNMVCIEGKCVSNEK